MLSGSELTARVTAMFGGGGPGIAIGDGEFEIAADPAEPKTYFSVPVIGDLRGEMLPAPGEYDVVIVVNDRARTKLRLYVRQR